MEQQSTETEKKTRRKIPVSEKADKLRASAQRKIELAEKQLTKALADVQKAEGALKDARAGMATLGSQQG